MSAMDTQQMPRDTRIVALSLPQPQHLVQLVNLLENYPVFNNLCSHLEIVEINTLRKVTKRWSNNLSAHLTERWNINKKLRRFVTDPKTFRSVLGSCDALISGSFAIQFFDGVVWEESDLDIFVECSENAARLIEYLETEERYKFVQAVDYEKYCMHDLVTVKSPALFLAGCSLTLVGIRLRHIYAPTMMASKRSRAKSNSCGLEPYPYNQFSEAFTQLLW